MGNENDTGFQDANDLMIGEVNGHFFRNGVWEPMQPQLLVFANDGRPVDFSIRIPTASPIATFRETPPSGKTIQISELRQTVFDKYRGRIKKLEPYICTGSIRKLAKEVNACESGKNDGLFVDRLRQLKILDLGCGSENSPDNRYETHNFDPWLCRALHALGIDVTGVDLFPPVQDEHGRFQNEEWKFKRLDLTEDGALNIFPSNSFDVINMDAFLGHRVSTGMSSPTSFRGHSQEFDDPRYKHVEKEVFTQTLRILKPGGILFVNNQFAYTKRLKPGNQIYFEFIEPDGTVLPGIEYADPSMVRARISEVINTDQKLQ